MKNKLFVNRYPYLTVDDSTYLGEGTAYTPIGCAAGANTCESEYCRKYYLRTWDLYSDHWNLRTTLNVMVAWGGSCEATTHEIIFYDYDVWVSLRRRIDWKNCVTTVGRPRWKMLVFHVLDDEISLGEEKAPWHVLTWKFPRYLYVRESTFKTFSRMIPARIVMRSCLPACSRVIVWWHTCT